LPLQKGTGGLISGGTMTDRSAPAGTLRDYIVELEAELESALRACPERQNFEVDALRKRVALARAAFGTIS
jgi:hypothetical protein